MSTKGKVIPPLILFVYTLGSVVVPYLNDGRDATVYDWIAILSAAVTIAGTYLTPLIPEATWTKTAQGVLLAALTTLALVLPGGLTAADTWDIVTAVLVAAGIQIFPARSVNGVHVGWGSDRYALAA